MGELVVFMPFVTAIAIVWIVFYFRDRRRRHDAVTEGVKVADVQLTALAEKLERRVQALESLLDAEVPGWRATADKR